ncbi:MAG: S1 RNA-binding domain-containing protein [Planctomycetia bacterium]|jgi:small subunit ribosomal protein S1
METDPRPQSESNPNVDSPAETPQSDENETQVENVTETPAAETTESAPAEAAPAETQEKPKKQRILIGSQRDAAKDDAKPERDWYVPKGVIEAEEKKADQKAKQKSKPKKTRPVEEDEEEPVVTKASTDTKAPVTQPKHFPPPNLRDRLPAELEAELEAALGDQSMDDLLVGSDSVTQQEMLQPESKQTCRVVSVHQDDVFVELGGREQGVLSLKSIEEDKIPAVGDQLDVIVKRYNREDGLYELMLPHSSIDVADWSDLSPGIMVEVRVTGHNSGGLECEANHIRGFIPISQVSLYRVENLEEFVGEKWSCIVTEANPQRRNLVVSRRAALEREREEAREKLLATLEPGQIHEGTVRKIMDFGAFVDIGGVDGLLHISQLGWGRVKHPSEVLSEGQAIKVKVQKVDPETKKISFSYRDMLESPWENVEMKFPVNSPAKGTVAKIMDFGAFVELEPGVEGLVHISELSHKRVFRTSDVVSEGDEVDVMIQSIDKDAQRISLSMKAATTPPEPEKKEGDTDDAPLDETLPKPSQKKHKGPLKGGVGGAGDNPFGLRL